MDRIYRMSTKTIWGQWDSCPISMMDQKSRQNSQSFHLNKIIWVQRP